jgi:hypothetical protein
MAMMSDKWHWSGWLFIVGRLSGANVEYMLDNEVHAYLITGFLVQGSC